MQNTPNYNYNLPEYSDSADIAVLNANFSSIDANEHRIEGEVDNHDTRISALEEGVDLEKSATNSFDDGIDSLFKKVVSSIVPVQAGSGTPSPINERAISGFTECVVKDFGNNFMPQKDVSIPDALTNIPIYFDLPKGTYTISAKVSTDGSDTDCRYNVRVGNNAIAVGFLDVSEGRASSTFTIDQDCDRIYFYGGHATATQANTTYTDIQIERGSTPTAYTPYVAPNTATISFGSAGTVYGARVELISGKLVVTRAGVDMGSLSYTHFSVAEGDLFRTQITGAKIQYNVNNLMCSSYSYANKESRFDGSYSVPDNSNLDFINNAYSDATAFKTAMTGQTLVYELATPQEYQLTPAQLRSLVGANRLASSTGEVTEVEYITNKTIAWLLDLIRAQEV